MGGGGEMIQQIADFFRSGDRYFFSFRSLIIKKTIIKKFLKTFIGQFSKNCSLLGSPGNKN